MIELYSGTPGSGKSYHACDRIYYRIQVGTNIIANFPVVFPEKFQRKKHLGEFLYLPNEKLTVDALVAFSNLKHEKRKEHQTLLIIDEAGIKFNSRLWNSPDRFGWLNFFSQHRKFGYDIILISQSDIMLDKQLRQFIEIEHNHRLMWSCGTVGKVLTPIATFLDVKSWYGIKMPLGTEFIKYWSKIANIYDSYALFDKTWKDNVNG